MENKQKPEIILAGPERKRILREILGRPEKAWSRADKALYCNMLYLELKFTKSVDDQVAAKLEKDYFVNLVSKGVSPAQALDQAEEQIRLALREKTKGRRERERRRKYREAVTGSDGATAVTTGLVLDCIICGKVLPGGPINRGGKRGDAAYCSDACRQKAYRSRCKMKLLKP